MTTYEKLIRAFQSMAFSVDDGALLTSYCDDGAGGIEIKETDCEGLSFDYHFTEESLEDATIGVESVLIQDSLGQDTCEVSFYSLIPVNIDNLFVE